MAPQGSPFVGPMTRRQVLALIKPDRAFVTTPCAHKALGMAWHTCLCPKIENRLRQPSLALC